MIEGIKDPFGLFDDTGRAHFYKYVRSPFKEKLAVSFTAMDYQYLPRWDENVENGKDIRIVFPDKSKPGVQNWQLPLVGLGGTWLSCRFMAAAAAPIP